jgi:hypothetical protein
MNGVLNAPPLLVILGVFSFPNFCCHGVSGILISTNDTPAVPETISILCARTFRSDYILIFVCRASELRLAKL